jgi:hypothetical protein
MVKNTNIATELGIGANMNGRSGGEDNSGHATPIANYNLAPHDGIED